MKGKDVSLTAILRVPSHPFRSYRLLPVDFRQSTPCSDARNALTTTGYRRKNRFDGEIIAISGPE